MTKTLKLAQPKRERERESTNPHQKFVFIKTISVIFCVGFIFLYAKPASATTWLTGWSYRQEITINHTKVAADQTNFPVLISLDALSNINADGNDIRFTSSDGVTELPREIESYSSGSLRAWVKVPALSSSTDTVVYMYYGNSSAAEPATSSTYGSQNVWKTDGVDISAEMIQHMKDTTTSTVTDSTSNANDGTKKASNEPVETTGKIGNGQSFDGVNGYIVLPQIELSEFSQIAQSPDLGIHQGIATDGTYFYLFHTSFIKKTDLNWNQVVINNNVNAESGNSHIGDGSYYNGKLYVPTDNWTSCSSFNPAKISIWNASDLSFVESSDISAQGHEASSLYADGDTGILYIVSYCDGSKIWKYSLTDLSYIGYISLSSSLVEAQGIAKSDNYFYITAGSATIYQVSLTGTVQGIVATHINEGIDYYQSNLYGLNDGGSGNSFVYTFAPRSSKAATASMWVNIPYLPSEIVSNWMKFIWTDDDNISVYYDKGTASLKFKLNTLQGTIPRPIVLESNLYKNQWMYISAVYDGLNAQIYVNGVLKNSVVRDGTGLLSNWKWQIGGASSTINGSIDEVRIYNRALSTEEITTQYNNINSPSTFYALSAEEHHHSYNPQQGTITVTAVVINDNGGTKTIADFPLFVNSTQVTSGTATSFSAPANAYTVTATANASYTQSFSGDCDTSGRITLSPGDYKICTVTNNDTTSPIADSGLRGASITTPYTTSTTTVTTTSPTSPIADEGLRGASGLTSAQITSILNILASFGADADTISNVQSALSGTAPVVKHSVFDTITFTRDLKLNSTGADVQQLQQFLNNHGFTVANTGPGSEGNETEKFGILTQTALIKFQKAYNIVPAVGYFGPVTRAKISTL